MLIDSIPFISLEVITIAEKKREISITKIHWKMETRNWWRRYNVMHAPCRHPWIAQFNF